MTDYIVCKDCLIHEIISEYVVHCERCVSGEGSLDCVVCDNCRSIDVGDWFDNKTLDELKNIYGIVFVKKWGLDKDYESPELL